MLTFPCMVCPVVAAFCHLQYALCGPLFLQFLSSTKQAVTVLSCQPSLPVYVKTCVLIFQDFFCFFSFVFTVDLSLIVISPELQLLLVSGDCVFILLKVIVRFCMPVPIWCRESIGKRALSHPLHVNWFTLVPL